MIYVSSQPDTAYFHWQVEIYCRNFMRLGVLPHNIHVIFLIDKQESKGLRELRQRVPVEIFCYQIEPRSYVPAYKPQGMKHHAQVLGKRRFFYHDSDIIFTDLPRVNNLCMCACYGSNVASYLDTKYIQSKGEGLLEAMCNSIGIHPNIVRACDDNVVGAQYILNNLSYEFWEKVEQDSLILLQVMSSWPIKEGLVYGIQSWTAEMWATYWNLLAYGKTVKTHPELDFTFATSKIEALDRVKILHNAGVTVGAKDKLFYKADYMTKSPLGENFDHLSREYASWKYIEEIRTFDKITTS